MVESDLRIGFLGAGKMATALARGWLEAGLTAADRVLAGDPVPQARTQFAEDTGTVALEDNRQVVQRSEVVVLAVKPQTMAGLLAEIRPVVTPQHLIISVAAGVTLGQLAEALGLDRRLVRVMPNTPCLVGASAAGYAAGPAATAADLRLVDRLLSSVGKAFALPEKLLDAVTGLSGSGPAYVFVLIEALSDGGVRVGLPRDVATQLAAQTVYGAAKMVLETGLHPAALKDQVASPGGTTAFGLHALEKAGFRAALIDAVEAATNRSLELGK
jgi:pyrroline-5-carboxylate reductase